MKRPVPHDDDESESPFLGFSPVLRKILFGILLLALLGGCVWGGWRLFEAWGERRTRDLLRQAREAVAAHRVGFATSILRDIMLRDADNAPAVAMMAELAKAHRAPEALYWWRRLNELRPADLVASVNLASLLLQRGELDEADRVIDAAGQHHGERPDLLALQAAAKARRGRLDEGRALFVKASRLDPRNWSHRLNALALDLASADRARQEDARARLAEESRAETPGGALALELLLQDAMFRRDRDAISRCARALAARPDAGFDRCVACLDAFRSVDDARSMRELLDRMRRDAADAPARLLALHAWANAAGLAAESLDWVATLDPRMIRQPPFCIAIAESYALLGRSGELETWTHRADWQGYPFFPPFLLARLRCQEGAPDEKLWEQVVTQAKDRPAGFHVLLGFARRCGWERERERLLWEIVRDPGARPIPELKELHAICQKNRDANGLYRVLLRAYELEPDNPIIQNNLASLEFLLYGPRWLSDRLAGELYARDPANPGFATTHALGCHLRGKHHDGLAAIEKLAPKDRDRPDVRLYHAILLAACGRVERALERARGLDETMFLPPEWAMLQTTLARAEKQRPATATP